MAFQRIEPLGMDRQDFYAGMIAASNHNAMRGKKGRVAQALDFIPWRERSTQTLEDQVKRMAAGAK